MKQFLFLFPLLLLVLWISAQPNKDSCCLAKKDLVGVWQRDLKGVGNGVEQNFRFFADGIFFLDMGSDHIPFISHLLKTAESCWGVRNTIN
jgi:hypothetical protein